LLSYDEDKACAEVIADKDYMPGEQVVISYGRLPNTTLALDFGFTLPFSLMITWKCGWRCRIVTHCAK